MGTCTILLLHEVKVEEDCSLVETLMRTRSLQTTVSETLSGRNTLFIHTDCCSSHPGGHSQTTSEVKTLDVEVLGWSEVTRPLDIVQNSLKHRWSCVYEPSSCF